MNADRMRQLNRCCQGLCRTCDKPRRPNRKQCQACADIANAKDKARRAK